jgi:hypothetical protein
MIIIDSVAVRFFRAAAITVCPFIFIDQGIYGPTRGRIIKHEKAHWWQQLPFGVIGALLGAFVWLLLSWPLQLMSTVTVSVGAIEGWVVGQMVWRWFYLVGLPFGLPVWWNPCRRWWETAAYRAQGMCDDEIRKILSKPPYYLRG